ncbi:MAG: hypothetical protein ACR2OO_17380 [Thermomicrobiales bacterium]
MEIGEIASALIRRWWIVLLVPFAAGVALTLRDRGTPYRATMRATVLIPGDTEIPGSAERPELMVMDDVPALVASRVFAEGVAKRLKDEGTTISPEVIQSSLGGSRYSRILTVTATNADRGIAEAVASGAASALPDLVNAYLVGNGGKPATVRIIDPPGAATRDRPNRRLILLAQLVVAAMIGAGLAVAADRTADGTGSFRLRRSRSRDSTVS